jgi:hypothetical protein
MKRRRLIHRRSDKAMPLIGERESALQLCRVGILHVSRTPRHQRVRTIVDRLAEGVPHAHKKLLADLSLQQQRQPVVLAAGCALE